MSVYLYFYPSMYKYIWVCTYVFNDSQLHCVYLIKSEVGIKVNRIVSSSVNCNKMISIKCAEAGIYISTKSLSDNPRQVCVPFVFFLHARIILHSYRKYLNLMSVVRLVHNFIYSKI